MMEGGILMKIVVNGGHCPDADSGALGSKSEEAVICRGLMELTSQYLLNVGFEVLCVQKNELAEIVAATDAFGADLFVSIHCNAAENKAARGTEVFFASAEGMRLAVCLQKQITLSLGTVNRGVKDGSWLYVLKNTEAIGVLVETAFISNPEDEELLLGQADGFARAIAPGFTDYLAECMG
jgi:N-acetylmuramoyl-L-alanine amidase